MTLTESIIQLGEKAIGSAIYCDNGLISGKNGDWNDNEEHKILFSNIFSNINDLYKNGIKYNNKIFNIKEILNNIIISNYESLYLLISKTNRLRLVIIFNNNNNQKLSIMLDKIQKITLDLEKKGL